MWFYFLLIDIILVWVILVLGKEVYQNGGSPIFEVVEETWKVFAACCTPVVRAIPGLFKNGGGLALKLFKRFTKR